MKAIDTKTGELIEIESLSKFDLQMLAREKGAKGCATARALRAQYILWEMAGFPWSHPFVNINYDIDMEEERESSAFYEAKAYSGSHRFRDKKNLIPEKRNNSEYRRFEDWRFEK